MKNILQIISDAGIELTDDQKSAVENGVKDNYKTIADYDKQTQKLSSMTTERDNYKTQYETAAETLKGFEGKDYDTITKERDDWKKKAEKADADWKKQLDEAETKYNQQIEERDFNDALTQAMSKEKFTSEFAKKGIMDMVKQKGLKREGEKILGLDDYIAELKESQKDAFIPDEEPVTVPTYTTPTPKETGDGKKPFTVPKIW